MTDHSDLIAELRDLLTDWNGADLPDSELPRVDILCGTIRRAASALSSQSLSLSEAREEIERQKTRGDNHWETLRGIRDIARTTGDLERIVLWVNDAGSGYTERPEATIASLTDRVNDAEKALEPFSVGADVERLLTAAKAAKRYLEPDLVEPGRTVFWNLVSAINAMEGKP